MEEGNRAGGLVLGAEAGAETGLDLGQHDLGDEGQVYGGALDELLDQGAQALIAEATEEIEQAELPL